MYPSIKSYERYIRKFDNNKVKLNILHVLEDANLNGKALERFSGKKLEEFSKAGKKKIAKGTILGCSLAVGGCHGNQGNLSLSSATPQISVRPWSTVLHYWRRPVFFCLSWELRYHFVISCFLNKAQIDQFLCCQPQHPRLPLDFFRTELLVSFVSPIPDIHFYSGDECQFFLF